MRAIAFDPGHTTGVVFYYDRLGFPSGALSLPREEVLKTFERHWWDDKYDLYLLERIPERGDPETVALYVALRDRFGKSPEKLKIISPGNWKPWIKQHPLPEKWLAPLRDPHQRDAASLLYWFLETHTSGARAK